MGQTPLKRYFHTFSPALACVLHGNRKSRPKWI